MVQRDNATEPRAKALEKREADKAQALSKPRSKDDKGFKDALDDADVKFDGKPIMAPRGEKGGGLPSGHPVFHTAFDRH